MKATRARRVGVQAERSQMEDQSVEAVPDFLSALADFGGAHGWVWGEHLWADGGGG